MLESRISAYQFELDVLGFTVIRCAVSNILDDIRYVFEKEFEDNVSVPTTLRQTLFNSPHLLPIERHIRKNTCLEHILTKSGDIDFIQSEMNVLKGDSTWHRDGKKVPYHAYRIAIYIDGLNKRINTLEFLPGSHRCQEKWTPKEVKVLEEYYDNGEFISETTQMPFSINMELAPGDVVVFNSGIMHASYGGSSRRQIAFVYVGNPIDDEDKVLRTKFCLNRMLYGTKLFI